MDVDRSVEVVVRDRSRPCRTRRSAHGDAGPACARLLLAHQQHRRGAVADLRRVAGGVDAVLHDRLECGQRPRRWSRAGRRRGSPWRSRRWACPPWSTTGACTGTISRSKRPSAHAAAARRCDSRPRASTSPRLMPRLLGDALGRGELVAACRWSSRPGTDFRSRARSPGPGTPGSSTSTPQPIPASI